MSPARRERRSQAARGNPQPESKPRHDKERAESANQGGTAGKPRPCNVRYRDGVLYFTEAEEVNMHDISRHHSDTAELLG